MRERDVSTWGREALLKKETEHPISRRRDTGHPGTRIHLLGLPFSHCAVTRDLISVTQQRGESVLCAVPAPRS